MSCRICGTSEGQRHCVKEMMFGTKEEFLYFECAHCGCLQLENPPENLSRYYPSDRYYSFQAQLSQASGGNRLRKWIKRRRDAAVLFERGGVSGWIARRYPNPGLADVKSWIAPTGIRQFTARLLDVGCGRGETLFRLAELGFANLTGIDPFAPEEALTGPVRILKRPLEALKSETFDLVMFHHAFEHLPNPLETLRLVRGMLAGDGACLIRLPIASNGPWRLYGSDWAEIDAPRHFFLHTEMSLSLLANQSGFRISHIDYEAEPFSYAASELYRQGKSLYSPEQDRMLHWTEAYSPAEIARIESLAQEYNVPGWAGRAAFYFRPTAQGPLSVGFVKPG